MPSARTLVYKMHTQLISEPNEMTGTMSISVIVPVRNEEQFIQGTLDGLLSQDYPQDCYEILVIDGDSTDATPAIVREYAERHPHIHLFSNAKKWSSAARNIGIENAKGSAVVIVDGHCEFVDDQYLKNVESAFDREDIDCLGRPQCLEISDGSQMQMSIAAARASRLGHHPDSFIYSDQERTVPAHSVAVAYRKNVFDTVGLFDERFDACEDVELNHRIDKASLKCLLAPKILLKYHPRSSLLGLFRQMGRYGRGRVRLFRKHPETFSFKSFLPALFVLFLIVGCVASLIVPWPIVGAAYWSVVCVYLAILLFFSAEAAMRERIFSHLYLMPCVFATIHIGAGWGLLREFIFGSSVDGRLVR